MIQNTLKSWSEDYYGPDFLEKRDPVPQKEDAPSESSSTEVVHTGHSRKRAPFVPFLLRNETGIRFSYKLLECKTVLTITGKLRQNAFFLSFLSQFCEILL